MIESMVVACDSEMENMKHIQTFNKNLLLAKLYKFINDTVGFVKDTEIVENPSGGSTPNESWEAENAKMI